MWKEWFNHPYNINLTHKGKASVNVRIGWLVAVKTYGINPIELLIIIKIKIEKGNRLIPKKWFDLKRLVNSFFNVEDRKLHIVLNREVYTHKVLGIKNKIKNTLSQLKENPIIWVEGSKIEKRLVIIFTLAL